MADVQVVISSGEETAAGLGSNIVTYTNATGDEVTDVLLRVWRGDWVMAEYPTGRYVSWSSV
jgi:hypothetical protein